MAMPMVKWIPHVRIVVFQEVGKSIGQTIHTLRIYHFIIGSSELIPFEGAGILTIFVKLSFKAGSNEQKQDDEHPAFVNVVIYQVVSFLKISPNNHWPGDRRMLVF